MRVVSERLTFMAVCALFEEAELVAAEPIAPSFGVRLALAFLCDQYRADREPFEAYWKALREPSLESWSETQRRDYRRTEVASARDRIVSALRIPSVELLLHDVGVKLHGPPANRWAPYETRIALLRAQRAERLAAAEERRRRKDCGFL